MHRSEEDYLKAIYELTINTNSKIIKSSDLADELGFTIQSVNEKIKRLDEKGYVKFVPYKGVSLTKKGLDESIRMIRTHRIDRKSTRLNCSHVRISYAVFCLKKKKKKNKENIHNKKTIKSNDTIES